MKKVEIRSTQFGLEWHPERGRWYSISPQQIFPERHRQTILKCLMSTKSIFFNWFEYDKTNKILFLENIEVIENIEVKK